MSEYSQFAGGKPAGAIEYFAKALVVPGYVELDGSVVDKANYPGPFACYGDTPQMPAAWSSVSLPLLTASMQPSLCSGNGKIVVADGNTAMTADPKIYYGTNPAALSSATITGLVPGGVVTSSGVCGILGVFPCGAGFAICAIFVTSGTGYLRIAYTTDFQTFTIRSQTFTASGNIYAACGLWSGGVWMVGGSSTNVALGVMAIDTNGAVVSSGGVGGSYNTTANQLVAAFDGATWMVANGAANIVQTSPAGTIAWTAKGTSPTTASILHSLDVGKFLMVGSTTVPNMLCSLDSGATNQKLNLLSGYAWAQDAGLAMLEGNGVFLQTRSLSKIGADWYAYATLRSATGPTAVIKISPGRLPFVEVANAEEMGDSAGSISFYAPVDGMIPLSCNGTTRGMVSAGQPPRYGQISELPFTAALPIACTKFNSGIIFSASYGGHLAVPNDRTLYYAPLSYNPTTHYRLPRITAPGNRSAYFKVR